jgi:hypothetical protein
MPSCRQFQYYFQAFRHTDSISEAYTLLFNCWINQTYQILEIFPLLFLLCICSVSVAYMLCFCCVYVLFLLCICSVSVVYMLCVCCVYALFLLCICPVSVVYILCFCCVYVLFLLCIFCFCCVYALFLLCICSVSVVYMLFLLCICSVSVLFLFCLFYFCQFSVDRALSNGKNKCLSRESNAVGTAWLVRWLGHGLDNPGFEFYTVRKLSRLKTSRPAPRPTQTSVPWVSAAPSCG